MGAAFAWGLLAASSLVLGALIAFFIPVNLRAIGLVMGFGAGVLISAVAFDLVEEASNIASGQGAALAGLFVGCACLLRRRRAHRPLAAAVRARTRPARRRAARRLAIVLGTVLDGIPESIVIGLTLFESGAIGVAYLVAVFISNVPEAISSTAGLPRRRLEAHADPLDVDRDRGRVRAVVARGIRALPDASPDVVAFVLTFAAGAILTMLADTMIPEAYRHGGKLVGVVTTLGFAVAYVIHTIE